jgi:hypothetical protein
MHKFHTLIQSIKGGTQTEGLENGMLRRRISGPKRYVVKGD